MEPWRTDINVAKMGGDTMAGDANHSPDIYFADCSLDCLLVAAVSSLSSSIFAED